MKDLIVRVPYVSLTPELFEDMQREALEVEKKSILLADQFYTFILGDWLYIGYGSQHIRIGVHFNRLIRVERETKETYWQDKSTSNTEIEIVRWVFEDYTIVLKYAYQDWKETLEVDCEC